jgi:phosphoglycolate phosphatase
MPIKLILFDLDGTLVDTSKDITNALNYALKQHGIQELTVQDTVKMVGEGITRLIEKVIGDEKFHMRDNIIKMFIEYYSEHLADYSREYPYVRETLEQLSRHKKAIISNKRESLSIELLKKLDLSKYFDLVAGSDTTSEKKPSPVPIFHIMGKLEAKPYESMIVGDSSFDIEAGKKAGIKTVAVSYGYRESTYLQDADYMIDSLKDLVTLILKEESGTSRQ